MLVRAGEQGLARMAAEVAVLLSEQGLGGNDPDLEVRLRRWRTDGSKRSESARRLAETWRRMSSPAHGADGAGDIARCVALAFPDRIARRRSGDGANWISAGGRGYRLDPTSSLGRAEWLAVAETQGAASGARILAAASLSQMEVEAICASRIETVRELVFDPTTGGVTATRQRRLGAIRLSSGPDPDAEPDAISAALLEGIRQHGLGLLPWSDRAAALRARAAYAGIANLSDTSLLGRLDEWLSPLLSGHRRLADIPSGALVDALRSMLGWEGQRALEAQAPERFVSPLGNSHAVDYAADGGPAIELRVQELFGLATHPMAGRTPLTLRLTSPAGRPIQTTRDLPGFWKGSWAAVAKEMRADIRVILGRMTPPPPRRRCAPSARHLDRASAPDRDVRMVEARIRQRTKSSMQSGKANTGNWVLEFEPAEAKRADPLTGWAGSGDVRDQVRIGFPTLEAARAYAARHGLAYHVVPASGSRLKLQAYADNFKGPDLT